MANDLRLIAWSRIIAMLCEGVQHDDINNGLLHMVGD
jgi:hypothetical protein